MKNIFKKTILVAIVAALAFAVFPFANAFALGANPEGEVSNEKLEQMWARQLQVYERLGKAFDDDGGRLSKLQERIDRAAANGKDVAALQAALDAYEAALKSARPAYESVNGIGDGHELREGRSR